LANCIKSDNSTIGHDVIVAEIHGDNTNIPARNALPEMLHISNQAGTQILQADKFMGLG